jgi:poly(hydroxyalkanoate) depolymerase family esterase
MLNFSNLKGLQQPSGHINVPAHMAQALAMVREGRLQEASVLLMGHGNNDEVVGSEAAGKATPPNQRISDLAARGLASVQDVLDKMDFPGGIYSASPTQAAAPRTSKQHHSDPSTQAASTRPEEPGRFECVAFTHNGVSHPYFLYTPQTSAPAGGRPLVMMLHGCTQDAQDFARGTCMNATAEAAGALVLYPTQSQSANANGCWNWFRPEDQKFGAGEPALLRAMLQHAMNAQPVDLQRVFVAGLSAGGAMAAVMAQQYPRVFAAVGVHSGLPPGAATSMMGALSAMKSGAKGWSASLSRDGARAVPMIVMHGDADKTVHKRNAEQLLQSAAAGIVTTVQTQDKGVSSDGQRYTRTCVLDSTAPSQVVAERWLLQGAGHAWSGGDASGSHASARGVNASAEMMRFFLAHPRQGV